MKRKGKGMRWLCSPPLLHFTGLNLNPALLCTEIDLYIMSAEGTPENNPL